LLYAAKGKRKHSDKYKAGDVVTIRKTKNYGLIGRLDVKVFGEDEVSDEPYEACTWFLLIVDDKVAGFAGLSVFDEGGRKQGFLERAAVLKPFRGRGLQKLLIAARDQEARRLGLEHVYTYTAFENNASSNSLMKCGYKLYTPQSKYGLKGALYWYKKPRGT
jgi:GNAT superfamily N-acetyltransferase